MAAHRLIAIAFTLLVAAHARAGEPELWVYAPVNFQVNGKVDALIALLERAKKAGYHAAVITDYKFGKLDERPDHFWHNLRRTRDAADRVGIELIPCVFPIGYSGSLLQNDPNLAEAMPVRNCPLVVRNGRAVVADADNLLNGGAFEIGGGHAPAGWNFVDGFGSTSGLDTTIKHGGKSSLRLGDFRKGNEAGNARIARKVTVEPWRQYEITAWIRTEGLDNPGELHIKALAGNRSLQHANLGVKRDQDWTEHRVVINSLGHKQITVYVGLWAGTGGTIWFDDVSMHEVVGVNMVRREGCPIRVTTEDGTELVEGRDFREWTNDKVGRIPWPGEFAPVTPQVPIALLPGAPVREGDRLRVDFWHTVTIYDGQVACCLLHDRVFELMREQATVLHRELRPKRWFMQHDEIRHAGWCGTCAGREGMDTCGKMLAANAERSVAVLREIDPKAGVIVWSDMFDPHHNAHDSYYLAASTFAGSWEGLDKSVVIANWNGGQAAKSLDFFGGRGHAQVVAGYYDHGDVDANVRRWSDAAKRSSIVPSAWMYTTWRDDYRHLERFAESARTNAPARAQTRP